MSPRKENPMDVCRKRHGNVTLPYHECLCSFDYRNLKSRVHALKYKHCLLADEMRRIDNFQLYIIIAVVVGVVLIFGVAAFCSCKWYAQTKTNPFSCFSCCKRKKKKKKGHDEDVVDEMPRTSNYETNGPLWPAIPGTLEKSMANSNHEVEPDSPREGEEPRHGLCMNFCMSDPVQDCCEFFDCDLMWRKKRIYTIPIFGKRKPAPLQRRPTRPAPPPPKPTVTPVVKFPEPMIEGYEDGMDCEPVPEAPPSPEPVRTDQPRAMYVDPLSFLQRPFLKATKEKSSEDESTAVYSKVKEFVFGKSKKSASVASLNKIGLSKSPDGVSTTSSKQSKYGRTGSLASLHNLSDDQLDSSYHSKRAMSLASLHMVEEEPSLVGTKGGGSKLLVARSRNSLHNIFEDDNTNASLKTDEYIDLEEMSKRIEAKMAAQERSPQLNHVESISRLSKAPSPPVNPKPNWTPNFIPASAYTKPAKPVDHSPSYPVKPMGNPPPYPVVNHNFPQTNHTFSPVMNHNVPQTNHTFSPPPHAVSQVPANVVAPDGNVNSHRMIPSQYLSPDAKYEASPMNFNGNATPGQYYPPVPATPEKPAVPARIAVGTPVINSGTLGRPKPVVPPRPPNRGSNSPRPRVPNSPRTSGRNSPRSPGRNSPRTPGRNSPQSPGTHSPKPRAPHPPNTLGRHPHVVKPTAPPPPPPVTTPIESSL